MGHNVSDWRGLCKVIKINYGHRVSYSFYEYITPTPIYIYFRLSLSLSHRVRYDQSFPAHTAIAHYNHCHLSHQAWLVIDKITKQQHQQHFLSHKQKNRKFTLVCIGSEIVNINFHLDYLFLVVKQQQRNTLNLFLLRFIRRWFEK